MTQKEQCFCDRTNLGAPVVSCGDCPNRDYPQQAIEGKEDPIEGEWHWVTDGERVWPAFRYSLASGGWSNLDCWEDWDRSVIGWRVIPKPLTFRGAT
jgi:hypothetical protein